MKRNLFLFKTTANVFPSKERGKYFTLPEFRLPYSFSIRKLLALSVALIIMTSLKAADRYWITTSDESWTNTANWSTSSGGSGGASVPVTGDRVFFDQGGAFTVSGFTSVTLATFTVSNNTNVTLTAAAGTTLSAGNGAAGNDLVIDSGSSLTAGTFVSVTLVSANQANIAGSLFIVTGRTFTTSGVTTVTGILNNAGTITGATATTLLINPTGVYQHNQNGGTIPTARWDAATTGTPGATCEITGATSSSPGSTGLAQTFYNFTWNCPGQTQSIGFGGAFGSSSASTTTNVNGNFTVTATGPTNQYRIAFASTQAKTYNFKNNLIINGGQLNLTSTTAVVTANVSGDLNISAGALIMQTGSTTSADILNITGNINLTGGTLDYSSSSGSLNGTINLAGNFNMSGGTFTKSANGNGPTDLVFNGVTQTATFSSSIVNSISLTVAASSATTFNSGFNINPNASLTVSGTANFTNKSVSFKSSATGTGRLAAVTGALLNATNVTTERYIGIPTSQRAWRFLTAPLTGGGTIAANWQTGGTGTGTNISGPTGTGFDYTTPGYSLKRYDVATQKYVGVTNTGDPLFGSSTTAANLPFMVFIAGDKTLNISSNAGSNNTVLQATGSPQLGNQIFSQTLTAGQYMPVGNPYASPVDFDALTLTNTPKKFYSWDPNLNTFGGYVLVDGTTSTYVVTPNNPTVPTSGNATGGSTAQNQFIQSGQAFFVQATAGATTSVTFTEAAKSTATVNNVFRTGNGSDEQLRVNLELVNTDNTTTLADGILADYSNDFSAQIDEKDGDKFLNDNENLSIESNNKSLMLERRPSPSAGDILNLKLTKTTARNYRFSIYPTNLPGDLTATLEDSYLKTSTPISLSDVTAIPFAVNNDAASAAPDRFKITFKALGVLPIGFTSVKALQKDQQIQVEWAVSTEANITTYEIEKSVNGRDFTKAGSVKANGSGNYNWSDVNATEGNNFYRIKGISITGEIKYSAVVNVKMGKGKSEIVAYPNPVKGNLLTLQLSNQLKGTYTIRLFNNIGQEVFNKSIQHNGGSATQTLQLSNNITKGMYRLQVTNGETTTNQQIICD